MKKTLLNGGGKPFIREMFYNEFISAVTAFTMLKMEYKHNRRQRNESEKTDSHING